MKTVEPHIETPPRSPGISVIMPTYNGEKYIEAALASLCIPTSHPDEVIVVDDGSTDATLEIVNTFSDRLPLRVLTPTPRRNWLAMTNLGLHQAAFEWSAILHQDDLWLPGRIGRLLPVLESGPSLVLMHTRFIDSAGRTVGSWRIPRSGRADRATSTSDTCSSLYVQNWVAVPSATFRTETAVAIGGLDETLWYTADWDLWLRLGQCGAIECVPHFGSAFRIHGSSQTIKGSQDLAGFREQMAEVQRRHRWAALEGQHPRLTERAGALSTETNVLLAGFLHHGRGGLLGWLATVMRAGLGGVHTYLRNSAIAPRLLVRLNLALRSRRAGSAAQESPL
jgi:GT2 family glycosyltransferase